MDPHDRPLRSRSGRSRDGHHVYRHPSRSSHANHTHSSTRHSSASATSSAPHRSHRRRDNSRHDEQADDPAHTTRRETHPFHSHRPTRSEPHTRVEYGHGTSSRSVHVRQEEGRRKRHRARREEDGSKRRGGLRYHSDSSFSRSDSEEEEDHRPRRRERYDDRHHRRGGDERRDKGQLELRHTHTSHSHGGARHTRTEDDVHASVSNPTRSQHRDSAQVFTRCGVESEEEDRHTGEGRERAAGHHKDNDEAHSGRARTAAAAAAAAAPLSSSHPQSASWGVPHTIVLHRHPRHRYHHHRPMAACRQTSSPTRPHSAHMSSQTALILARTCAHCTRTRLLIRSRRATVRMSTRTRIIIT